MAAIATTRSVRFGPSVKTHDGVCPTNALFDKVVLTYFTSGTCDRELAGCGPVTLAVLGNMCIDLAHRVETSTAGSAAVLPGGGGSASVLTSDHLPFLVKLHEVIVTKFCRLSERE